MGEFLRGMIQTLYEMMESLAQFSSRLEWLIGAIGHGSSDFMWAGPGGLKKPFLREVISNAHERL